VRANRSMRAQGMAETERDQNGYWTRRITLKYISGADGRAAVERRAAMPRLVITLRRLSPHPREYLPLAALAVGGRDGARRRVRRLARTASRSSSKAGWLPVAIAPGSSASLAARSASGSALSSRAAPPYIMWPMAMFGSPFGLMISHRPPCIHACWHLTFPTLSAE
jgi:hypothetical protein